MAVKRARVIKMRLDELAAVDVGAQEAQGTVVLKRGRESDVAKSVAGARKNLKAAIARHERHMDGTEDTDEKSQQKMMDEMKAALAELDVKQDDEMDMKKRAPTETKKRSALTSSDLGHSHLLYGIDDAMAGTTSHESTYVEGQNRDHYYYGHCHPWVRSDDGSISVGEAMGHTHSVGVMSAALEKRTTDEKSADAEKQRAAAANKSTQVTPTHEGRDTMKLVVLTEAQKSHYDTLTGSDAEKFLEKSMLERDADVEKARASDVVVFKGELTGIEVRKSHGEFARKLAETSEKNAEAAKKATESAEAEKAAREAETYKARAKAELGYLVGSDAVKAKVLQSIDGRIVPYTAEERDEALRMLKGADEIAKSQTHAPGYNPGDARETDALAEFNAGVAKYAEKNDIKDQGLALERFLGTTEGLALKKKYDATRAYGQQPGGR